MRDAYRDWVEGRIEDYKESISRDELLALADDVVARLRTAHGSQYPLTELLLTDAIDRRIARLLKLPGFRVWMAGNVSFGHVHRPENDTPAP